MPDKFSKETRSKIMQAIKDKHTKPEIMLRKALSAKGLRFRLHYGEERIDIAFPGEKVAVFVDGCFWHMCPKHGHIPKSNKKYWAPKLKKNLMRRKRKDMRLRAQGWKVLHFWEHQLKKPDKLTERTLKKMQEK